MARVSRPATANKIVIHVHVHDPNWNAFARAAHASQLELTEAQITGHYFT